ncbi:DsrE family protein [Undibacterium flavidum]|uniref:DsrE family protein n=1 Tax=Undibacterium flavidum TaxID=2762297 RepID=A0ABR6Y8J3_9BURK|nr:DsrE family protein [Undibacterium flavidum]MBC3872930.1 DsrE family protein [Undibacterium flavidum]
MKIYLKCINVALLFAVSFFMMSGFAAEREEKVIYHISDSANAAAGLRNARNHLEQSPKAKIVFVTHGAGIDFLLLGASDKNGNPYDVLVQELAARKVEFRVCNNTLIGRKIDKSHVLSEASIVPSGVAEVARLQIHEGYAYLKP